MPPALIPSDLWSPSERLIHALGRAAYAAAHGDAEAAKTLKLIFGTELLTDAGADGGKDRSPDRSPVRRQDLPSA